jgi:hypothetical protein
MRKVRESRRARVSAESFTMVSGAPNLSQAGVAIQWLWSLSRSWVAVTNRHSDCAAALPRRMNRSTRRLYLICPYTGSTLTFAFAANCA